MQRSPKRHANQTRRLPLWHASRKLVHNHKLLLTEQKAGKPIVNKCWGNHMVFDLWNFLSGLVAGAIGGSLLTFHLTKNVRADRHGTATDQSGARAGGDIVGRDKH